VEVRHEQLQKSYLLGSTPAIPPFVSTPAGLVKYFRGGRRGRGQEVGSEFTKVSATVVLIR
jgi:hypothetical protein